MPRRCTVVPAHEPDPRRLPSGFYVERLLQAREGRGLTRRRLAEQTGVPLEALRAAERGEGDLERTSWLLLSRTLGFPLGFFQEAPLGEAFGPAFLCGDWKKGDTCAVCGALAGFLCDYVVGARGRTCDLPLCERHRDRVRGEPDEEDDPDAVDYCPQHALLHAQTVAPVQLTLEGRP